MSVITISFRGNRQAVSRLDEIVASFISSKIRDSDGKKLNKNELMASIIAYLHQMPREDLEQLVLRGLEIAEIPFTIDSQFESKMQKKE